VTRKNPTLPLVTKDLTSEENEEIQQIPKRGWTFVDFFFHFLPGPQGRIKVRAFAPQAPSVLTN